MVEVSIFNSKPIPRSERYPDGGVIVSPADLPYLDKIGFANTFAGPMKPLMEELARYLRGEHYRIEAYPVFRMGGGVALFCKRGGEDPSMIFPVKDPKAPSVKWDFIPPFLNTAGIEYTLRTGSGTEGPLIEAPFCFDTPSGLITRLTNFGVPPDELIAPVVAQLLAEAYEACFRDGEGRFHIIKPAEIDDRIKDFLGATASSMIRLFAGKIGSKRISYDEYEQEGMIGRFTRGHTFIERNITGEDISSLERVLMNCDPVSAALELTVPLLVDLTQIRDYSISDLAVEGMKRGWDVVVDGEQLIQQGAYSEFGALYKKHFTLDRVMVEIDIKGNVTAYKSGKIICENMPFNEFAEKVPLYAVEKESDPISMRRAAEIYGFTLITSKVAGLMEMAIKGEKVIFGGKSYPLTPLVPVADYLAWMMNAERKRRSSQYTKPTAKVVPLRREQT